VLLAGTLGWFGMSRNLTPAVAPVAAIKNHLVPLWVIVLGIVLLGFRPPAPAPVVA
jgi:hypothetical protein